MSAGSGWTERFGALPRRDRRALLIGAAVLVPALLYTGAIRPYRAAVGELRDRVAAELALLEREEALLARAPSLPAEVTIAADELTRAELRLVRAANVPLAEEELIRYLESVASLSRTLLQELRGVEPHRGSAPPAAGFRPIRLSVRGESDLEGVVTFISRLEESPLLLRIAGLSIEPVVERVRGNPPMEITTGAVKFSVIVEGYAPPETRSVAADNQEALP